MKEAIETLLTAIEFAAFEHSAFYSITTPDIIMLKDAVSSLPQSSTEEEKDLWEEVYQRIRPYTSINGAAEFVKLKSTYKISKR